MCVCSGTRGHSPEKRSLRLATMQNWEAYLRAALRDLVRVRLTLRDLVRVGVGVTVRDGEGVRDAVREGVTVGER